MTNPLLAQFIPEARDLIQSSVAGLLKLEADPHDGATVNEVFRSVHTLKGSSGLFEAVALTRLVHAAEDLLGAIRLEEMELSSELVDGLLDSLDRVNVWLDELERHARLPADADGISAAMSGTLRAFFDRPAGAPAADAPAAAPAASTEAGPAAPSPLTAPFTEAARQAAFRRLANGEAILALRYRPNEGCFFNGTDPFGTMLQIPDLIALDAAPREPFAPLAELDPYRCILDFEALSSAPRAELEHLFRYDLEEVEIAELKPADCLRLFGEPDHAVIWADFAELGAQHLASGNLAALGEAAGTLIEMMSGALRPVSALRWLKLALECGPAGAAMLPGLVAAVAELPAPAEEPALRPVLALVASEPEAPAPDSGSFALSLPDGATGRVARRLLEAQREALALEDRLDVRLPAIARTLHNIAASLDAESFAAGLRAAGRNAGALRAVLDRALPHEAPPAPAASAPSAPVQAAPKQAVAAAPPPVSTAATHPTPTSGAPSRQLKVDQAKIDLLMNLIGELVVSKNSLPFLAKRAEEVYGSREMGREIKEQFAVIDRLAQEMQGAVMAVRMLPVSEVFGRFPRLVRDLSRKLGKRIALSVEGGETAADKTIIEALGDPLIHILRNSLDHGVETGDERLAVGKPEEATIALRAYQEADSVVIEISDDGRGIDPEKIRAAAIAKGVISADAAGRLSEQEAINLIYRPGFSTAAAVSDLSGRGVGMDVVLTTVERLGGSVSVTSKLGAGTLTRLSLPLSMAVTRVMVVETAGTLYGVPMDLIAETVRVPRANIRTIKRAEAFVLRDTVIPLLRMTTLLRLPLDFGQTPPEEEAILVCRVGGSPIGLVIDNFREGIEVLLKPLEGVLANIRGYSGTALLGDGRVLLVLNLKELL